MEVAICFLVFMVFILGVKLYYHRQYTKKMFEYENDNIAEIKNGFEKTNTQLIEENQKLIEWVKNILDTFGTMEVRERNRIQIPVIKQTTTYNGLSAANLIADPFAKVKIITRGELTSKIELQTQFASKTAIEAIKKAGGSFKKVAVPARVKKSDEE